MTSEWDGLSQESLLPGALVNARIRNVMSDGLLLSFLTYFHGTVDQFHLSTALPKLAWRQVRSNGPSFAPTIATQPHGIWTFNSPPPNTHTHITKRCVEAFLCPAGVSRSCIGASHPSMYAFPSCIPTSV